MISHREYQVVGFESGGPVNYTITLDELFLNKEDVEATYALRWDIDNILALSLGKALYIRLSRDDDNSLGIIKRIK